MQNGKSAANLLVPCGFMLLAQTPLVVWTQGHLWIVLAAAFSVALHLSTVTLVFRLWREIRKVRDGLADRNRASKALDGRIVKEITRLSRAVKHVDSRLRDIELQHIELIRWTETNLTSVDRNTIPWGRHKTLRPDETMPSFPDFISEDLDGSGERDTPREGTPIKRP